MICWHYCSNDSFIKIIQSHTLWLTDSSTMNDSTECKIMIDRINEYFDATPETPRSKNMKRTILANCQDRRFLSCFSLDADLLSQWCKYADDGYGIAICFDFSKLHIPDKLLLGAMNNEQIGFSQVIYNQTAQRRIIKDLILEHEQMCDNLAKNPEKQTIASSDILKCYQLLIGYSMVFKHPAFAEEKECRLIYAPYRDCKPAYRSKKGNLSPYFAFPFAFKDDQGELTQCDDVIIEIKLGPRNTSRPEDIQKFLTENGYTNVKITKSQIPYVG